MVPSTTLNTAEYAATNASTVVSNTGALLHLTARRLPHACNTS